MLVGKTGEFDGFCPRPLSSICCSTLLDREAAPGAKRDEVKEQALARFAARRLSRHHQWLTQQKAPLETWAIALHRLRIRVKKLRYTTDF
jgi:CHAD domain-containing protein